MAIGLKVWVGVVPTGPKGTPLNSSYQHRDSREYKEDLGYAVVNFARMVPDGLLVFFPSYGVLKSCTDFWKNTSVAGTGQHPTSPLTLMSALTLSLLTQTHVSSPHTSATCAQVNICLTALTYKAAFGTTAPHGLPGAQRCINMLQVHTPHCQQH